MPYNTSNHFSDSGISTLNNNSLNFHNILKPFKSYPKEKIEQANHLNLYNNSILSDSGLQQSDCIVPSQNNYNHLQQLQSFKLDNNSINSNKLSSPLSINSSMMNTAKMNKFQIEKNNHPSKKIEEQHQNESKKNLINLANSFNLKQHQQSIKLRQEAVYPNNMIGFANAYSYKDLNNNIDLISRNQTVNRNKIHSNDQYPNHLASNLITTMTNGSSNNNSFLNNTSLNYSDLNSTLSSSLNNSLNSILDIESSSQSSPTNQLDDSLALNSQIQFNQQINQIQMNNYLDFTSSPNESIISIINNKSFDPKNKAKISKSLDLQTKSTDRIQSTIARDNANNIFCEPIKKLCKVCGDRASYNNYFVLTCDACKTFFRRSILDQKKLRCHYNKKCEINVKSRKDCSYCRLKKCLFVGMKQELIGSEEEKKRNKSNSRNVSKSPDTYTSNSISSMPNYLSPPTNSSLNPLNPLNQDYNPFVIQNQNYGASSNFINIGYNILSSQSSSPDTSEHWTSSNEQRSESSQSILIQTPPILQQSSSQIQELSQTIQSSNHLSPNTVQNDTNNNRIRSQSQNKSPNSTISNVSSQSREIVRIDDFYEESSPDRHSYKVQKKQKTKKSSDTSIPCQMIIDQNDNLFESAIPLTKQKSSRRLSLESNDTLNFSNEQLIKSSSKSGPLDFEKNEKYKKNSVNRKNQSSLNSRTESLMNNSAFNKESSRFVRKPLFSNEKDEVQIICDETKVSKFKIDKINLKGMLSISKINEAACLNNRWLSLDNQLSLESLKRKDKEENEEDVYTFDLAIKRPHNVDYNEDDHFSKTTEFDEIHEAHSDSTSSGIGSPRQQCTHSQCSICLKGDCCKYKVEKSIENTNSEITIRELNQKSNEFNSNGESSDNSSDSSSECSSDSSNYSKKHNSSQSTKSTRSDRSTKSNKLNRSNNDSSEDYGIADTENSNSPADQSTLIELKNQQEIYQQNDSVCSCICLCSNKFAKTCELNKVCRKFSDFEIDIDSSFIRKFDEKWAGLHAVTQMIIAGDLTEVLKDPTISFDMIAFHLQNFGVNKMINAFKYLPSFRKLCKDDQKRLMQPCCSELLLLRSTKHFDSFKEDWEVCSQSKKDELVRLPFEMMKNCEVPVFIQRKKKQDLQDTYLEFCENVMPAWREDDLIMTIILTIILFSSYQVVRDKKLSEDLRSEKSDYEMMLKNYLKLNRYSKEQAISEYDQIQNLMKNHLTKLKKIFEFTKAKDFSNSDKYIAAN